MRTEGGLTGLSGLAGPTLTGRPALPPAATAGELIGEVTEAAIPELVTPGMEVSIDKLGEVRKLGGRSGLGGSGEGEAEVIEGELADGDALDVAGVDGVLDGVTRRDLGRGGAPDPPTVGIAKSSSDTAATGAAASLGTSRFIGEREPAGWVDIVGAALGGCTLGTPGFGLGRRVSEDAANEAMFFSRGSGLEADFSRVGLPDPLETGFIAACTQGSLAEPGVYWNGCFSWLTPLPRGDKSYSRNDLTISISPSK